MGDSFLPAAARELGEPAALAVLERIESVPVALAQGTVRTTYVRQGEGEPPLLLLHGFDSSVLEFRRLLPLLARTSAVWAIDLLGFGFGERPATLAYTPQTICAHLKSFWQQQIARPVVLVGASMGGAAAIDFALAQPEAVAGLVLIDSVGGSPAPNPGRFLFPPVDALAAEFLRSRFVRSRVSANAYADLSLATPDAQRCGALHLTMPNWRRAIVAFTRSGGYGYLGERLAQLAAPTLIIWGERDRILGTEAAGHFQQKIPHSQLVWIPECGHVPHLEKAERTAQLIGQFCAAGAIGSSLLD
ncbi:alpha/beta fold hydrolase [Gloeobacter kilaueensis]|uniref:Alpha/beta hydrolase fold protein n=1 Tax=Gloeobacter kilaueensis (strain ATCC BAA-2537 / CCAP 1431/1 / ULC 316 / JS1) TaxID=1183438 RepID=U5QPQ1_GLOK1|nr:alpha/beta hydrolase [Gloeobacter kilaueensis]AGY59675.1 alpha/beta hydrolase fold protein [Gloeobacter kilaueensis JS1]